jgi:hypothetical protein
MFYALLIAAVMGLCHSGTETNVYQAMGSVIVFRGDEVSVYSGGKKTILEEKKMPYVLYPGDEVGTGTSSDCEILLNSNDTLYVSPESLVGIDLFKTTSSTISLRYGIVMFRGNSSVNLQSKDFLAQTSGGDFLMKYKRSAFETTVFNFGPDFKVKRDMDKKYVDLPTNSYARLASFKEGKKLAKIKEGAMPAIYDVFRISYRPAGSTTFQTSVPGTKYEAKKDIPYTKIVNLDTIKRTIGF